MPTRRRPSPGCCTSLRSTGRSSSNLAAGPIGSWAVGPPGTATGTTPGHPEPGQVQPCQTLHLLNLQNTATVEFRIFRGAHKRNTLLVSLKLVDKICYLTLYLSDEEMQGLAWTTFVSFLREQDCPELV